MTDFYYLYNAYTPFERSTLELLSILAPDYRISLPLEAKAPNPVPQSEMLKNGVVGIYTTTEAIMRPGVDTHLPIDLEMRPDLWLIRNPRI